ncbi:Imm6 family immunity protein [Metabacillus sp. Hm71]|uniref:Imm6 family immunity protein n=1 Tax=Metabacillus sp. Hm71 TaxID=3450743 RepID=UPI003F41EE1E
MRQFDNLSADAKVVYLLSLSELIIDNISQSEGYEVAVESLEKAWEWVKFKNIEAFSLYLYLENMDETDIMTYMQFEDDSTRERVWICIGNALAYTILEAYQYEKEKYLPQTIESVDYETVESFITNFNEVYESDSLADKLLRYLEINYPNGTGKKVDINLIKTFINDCIEK